MKNILYLLFFVSSFAYSQVKISQLPAANTPDGTELLETVQNGINKKLTINQVRTFTSSYYWPLSGTGTLTATTIISGATTYGLSFEDLASLDFYSGADITLNPSGDMHASVGGGITINAQSESMTLDADAGLQVVIGGDAGASGKALMSNGAGAVVWATPSGGSVGAQDKWIDASEITSRLTNGCAELARDAAGDNDYDYLAFDQTTQEFAQFNWSPPRNWNNGTVKVAVYWTAVGSPTGGVVWGVSAVAVSDDDALSTALGTAQTVSDTFIANNDNHKTAQTSAITIAGTPADGDLVTFQISRNPADASDTMTGDARLLGIVITYTLDAATSE